MCHCDLKPGNILIDYDIDERRLYCVITDFGITQVFDNSSLLVYAYVPVQINAASIAYAAPEALQKLKSQDTSDGTVMWCLDIYSYAILSLEVICRKRLSFK